MNICCKVCTSTNLSPVIDLGSQPIALHFLKRDQMGTEPSFPLCVVFCEECGTAQLNHTVPKEVMYSSHTYLSGMTKTLCHHFDMLAQEVSTRYFSQVDRKSVLDIGSNDGSQLQSYKRLGYTVTGVEASDTTAKIANENNIHTIHAFYNEETQKELNKQFDVINAAGVFFHLEELHSVTRGIKAGLKKHGVFVVQAMYMKNIVENGAFDQIYHEHLLYYTIKTLSYLLEQHDLELHDAYISPIHGGSIIGFASHPGTHPKSKRLQKLILEEELSRINTKERYLEFSHSLQELKKKNLYFLEEKRAQGKTVYGMGAPVKGNTLLNFYGITQKHLQYLTELNPLRKGMYAPGSHIEIILEQELKKHPDVYYVLAWNFKDEILRRNQNLIDQGVEFYFPVETGAFV